jgi:outer membrane protein assembly factor BamD (BamD/ComL family)
MSEAVPEQRPTDATLSGTTELRPESSEVSSLAPTPAPLHRSVWSWTPRKYRIRAIALLLVNLALFSGLCVFTHWLHYGTAIDFRWSSYLYPLRFWGPQTQNLYDFIVSPISVDQTPIHGIVIGLLFAAVLAVPILVAILYNFRTALPFVAAVFLLAHLPWLALTLIGSCVLAAVRPFRMNFRFGSALLAMLPIVLYLLLATRGPSEPVAASISPARNLLLAGPWLLAILSASMMMAVTIFIARAVNYRPDAVAPVMAVMFATPAIIFQVFVGVDELDYRVLETHYGPRSECFEPVQDATDTILSLLHGWTAPGIEREPRRSALLAVWSANPAEQAALKRRVSRRLLLDLMDDRRDAYQACSDFVADHPTSRYLPCVLFIQARALDTRLDQRKLFGESAQRELYTDFPSVQSEPIWTTLLTEYPSSPLAVAARSRVGQLRLRRGDADGALAALSPTSTRPAVPATPTQPVRRFLLRTRPPEGTLGYESDQDLFEAQQLRELIVANRDDPKYGLEPLRALVCLDPHRPEYAEQLLRLGQHYPDSLVYDDLIVRWAETTADRMQMAARLQACLARFPTANAVPEAMFALADLEIQSLGAGDENRRAAGVARLRELVARFDQSCWARRAAERLKMLAPRPVSPSQPAESP